jgi:phenylalanyl-tRNA synthetase beta chain
MQFSEAWLRSLVNPNLNSAELGHLLTMAGLEVEEQKPVAAAFTQVVVAQIVSAEKHPNADRLQVCQVNVGETQPLTIVCGAPNARAGLKTACALVGAELPNDFRIKQAKVRNVESFGMLCSAKELGIDESTAGIMELAEDAPVGAALRDWLRLDDHLITLKLTPNRGDCLSIAGIAREVAALTGDNMQSVDCSPVEAAIADRFEVRIAAEDACPRYCGRVIRGLNAAAITPAWMVERLQRCGLRPIHPVVDVTNYVLLELGQPMHAFDLARLQSAIEVRMAAAGEKLTLLNGEEISLQPDSLVIADAGGPLALAGIMGGQGSGVTETSRDIFLEAAHFTPDSIAGRARAYGLSTDSSHRFERGVDPLLPARALQRATRLILEICGGQVGPLIEVGPGCAAHAAIRLRPARVRRVLGVDIDDAAMAAIFQRLDMQVANTADGMLVTPPSHRFDLTREEDLIEEVVRVHGYEHIPAVAPQGLHRMAPVPESRRALAEINNLMVDKGYQEVITYSFIAAEADAEFRSEGDPLALLNPIASQMGVMRGSLLPGLLQSLKHNLNHGQERVRLFESGRVFLSAEAEAQPLRLAALAYGSAEPEQWSEKSRPVDFYDLRADLEALSHPARVDCVAAAHPALHPGQCARLEVNGVKVGWLGSLHPKLTQRHGYSRAPILFELDLAPLSQRSTPRYQTVPRLPAVRRDLAIVVDEGLAVGSILAQVQAAKPSVLSHFELFDVYQGSGVEAGKKSLAFKMLLQHTDKTLTDVEIDAVVQDVVTLLKNNFNASLRS